MSNFRKALMFTAIPVVVLHLISISLWLAEYNRLAEQIGWGATGLLVIAVVAAVVCSIKGVNQTAKGMWLGLERRFCQMAYSSRRRRPSGLKNCAPKGVRSPVCRAAGRKVSTSRAR